MSEATKQASTEQIVHITPKAIIEAKRLLELEIDKNMFLRLGVETGGCSGMSYSLAFDNKPGDFDREFEFDGLKVRVDLKALRYLAGTTVEFNGGLLGGGFSFSNPNAKRSCGCGSSFTC